MNWKLIAIAAATLCAAAFSGAVGISWLAQPIPPPPEAAVCAEPEPMENIIDPPATKGRNLMALALTCTRGKNPQACTEVSAMTAALEMIGHDVQMCVIWGQGPGKSHCVDVDTHTEKAGPVPNEVPSGN